MADDTTLVMGAVAYDPKVVTIWEGFTSWFAEHDFDFDYVLFSNYEAQAEAHFLYRLQTVGGFGGKSDQLNAYNVMCGNPGYFAEDLARYQSATAEGVRAAAKRWLRFDARIILSVVPRGQQTLALPGSHTVSVA